MVRSSSFVSWAFARRPVGLLSDEPSGYSAPLAFDKKPRFIPPSRAFALLRAGARAPCASAAGGGDASAGACDSAGFASIVAVGAAAAGAGEASASASAFFFAIAARSAMRLRASVCFAVRRTSGRFRRATPRSHARRIDTAD